MAKVFLVLLTTKSQASIIIADAIILTFFICFVMENVTKIVGLQLNAVAKSQNLCIVSEKTILELFIIFA